MQPHFYTGNAERVRAYTAKMKLLPLDRAWWFGRDIVDDAIDAFHFVYDAIGDAGQ